MQRHGSSDGSRDDVRVIAASTANLLERAGAGQFRHDRYAGTDIAKNFSSRIRLTDPSRHENRESLIFMNNPLRYRGFTFYQAGFDNNDTTTVLQVAQNPSWLVPYISCALIVIGMLVQFGMHLVSFVKRRVIA